MAAAANNCASMEKEEGERWRGGGKQRRYEVPLRGEGREQTKKRSEVFEHKNEDERVE